MSNGAEVETQVIDVIRRHLHASDRRLEARTRFVEDLGADSLAVVELTILLEETFEIEISDEAAERIQTVRDAIAAVEQCVARGCPDSGVSHDGGDAGDAGSATDGGCTGTAPNCFGNNAQGCCGQDPAGPAACVGGVWSCGTAPAPGCNGTSCLALDGSAG